MKTLTVMQKEWKEIIRSKLLVFNMVLIPVIFVLMPLALTMILGREDVLASSLTNSEVSTLRRALESPEDVQIFLLHESLFMFLMIPIFLPLGMAIYGILNERNERSLEPLLATPITVSELMLGKSLSIILPTMTVTWLTFAAFVVFLRYSVSPTVFHGVMRPMSLWALVLLPPALAQFTVSVGFIISSQVDDIRAASQIGGVIVLPVVGLTVMQLATRIVYSLTAFLAGIAGFLLLDLFLFWVMVHAFRRDSILTRSQA